MNEIDKAEIIQGLKAFLIPSSLFVACLLGAAGTFLIREGYQVGWCFIAATVVLIVSSFAAFCTFQNKLRFQGKMVDPEDLPVPDYDAAGNYAVEEGQASELRSAAGETPALPGSKTQYSN